jgi:GTP pyrophosphokinase
VPALPHSRKAIDRAGIAVRDWWLDPDPDVDLPEEAFNVLWEYRRTFRGPLQKVTVGMRQFVQRESTQILVAQRLKRVPTIVEKLVRLPAMKVTRMEDIGGCRAVLPGGRTEIEGVLRRIEKNRWEVSRFRDYIKKPKDTGYRAIHVVVVRDGRPIEIQLRTQPQHAWAAHVERAGAMRGEALKDGVGPPDLIETYRMLADSLAFSEEGKEPDMRFRTKFIRTYQMAQRRYPDIFRVT